MHKNFYAILAYIDAWQIIVLNKNLMDKLINDEWMMNEW